jgi:hypothetical protein
VSLPERTLKSCPPNGAAVSAPFSQPRCVQSR